jgi:hypothetical protein
MPAFDLGYGAHLAIVEGQPAFAQEPGGSRFLALAFAVPDLAAAVEHLERHGIELSWGIEAIATER